MSCIIISIFKFIFTLINLMAIISEINMWLWQWLNLFMYCQQLSLNQWWGYCLLYPPHNEVVGGYIGFTPSVRPSVRPSVPRPSRITCPLCSAYSSGWIHFIFTHLIKQLQKVCRVSSSLQNFKIRIFGNFLKYVTLTSCFDSGSHVNH